MTGKTFVTFLLDRTGSMKSCRDETIVAFNTYLNSLKEAGDAILFTFLQFDSTSLDKLHVAAPVTSVPELTRDTFVPRDMTPLIDASVKTIKAVEAALTQRDDNPKVVICIQTDGEENCSREHKLADLALLVKAKQALGWQFIFMGAGIDAYAQASRIGIGAGETVSYDKSSARRTMATFGALAENTKAYASGARMDTTFLRSQKAAAGDIYDKSPLDLTVTAPAVQPSGPVVTGVPLPLGAKSTVDDFAL